MSRPLNHGHKNRLDISAGDIHICHEPLFSIISTILSTDGYHNYTIKKNRFFKPSDFKRPVLSVEELLLLNRMKTLKKQFEWMGGRVLVKEMVGKTAPATHLRNICISYKTEGAPYLPDYQHLKISISHSGDRVAAGLCRNSALDFGIDIEKADRVPDSFFLKTAFTSREMRQMPDTPEGIFRQWTCKEAFLKFIGKGFNENLHTVEVLGDIIFYHGKPVDVSVQSWPLEEGYILSLVSGPPYAAGDPI